MPFVVNAGAVAMPFASVLTTDDAPPPVNVPLAPLDGAENVTLIPEIGFPLASATVAFSAVEIGVSISDRCGVPAVALTDEACRASFVSEKVAGVTTPAADAVTVYGPPAMPFAVNAADVATPLAFVVAVFNPPANVPLGPDCGGGAKVTVAPARSCPLPFLTVACKVAPKAVLIAALCGVPLVATIVGAPVAVTVKLSDFVAFTDFASLT
jgi:hypothetical protein